MGTMNQSKSSSDASWCAKKILITLVVAALGGWLMFILKDTPLKHTITMGVTTVANYELEQLFLEEKDDKARTDHYEDKAKFALGFGVGELITSNIPAGAVASWMPLWIINVLFGRYTLNGLKTGFETAMSKTWAWMTSANNVITLGAKSVVFMYAKDAKTDGHLSGVPDWLNPIKFTMMATGPLIGWVSGKTDPTSKLAPDSYVDTRTPYPYAPMPMQGGG